MRREPQLMVGIMHDESNCLKKENLFFLFIEIGYFTGKSLHFQQDSIASEG